MLETAVVIGHHGAPLHWHLPPGRGAAFIPDSHILWRVLWAHRDKVHGVAHTHPGRGEPTPSLEDLTTFAAVEAGLGRRLVWYIATEDRLAAFHHSGPERLAYAATPTAALPDTQRWLTTLRARSGYKARQDSGEL